MDIEIHKKWRKHMGIVLLEYVAHTKKEDLNYLIEEEKFQADVLLAPHHPYD